MRLASCRDLKAELSAEVTVDGLTRFAALPPMPTGLGVARQGDEYLLAVRTSDPALGEAIRQRAAGEADVQVVTVTKRNAFQGTMRPLEPGAQIGMKDKGFVGTLGCFVRDAHGLLLLTNSHVAADEGAVAPGWVIGQPFGSSPVAVLDRFVPFSTTAPNLVDAAVARLDRRLRAIVGWTSAINGSIRGARALTPDDLGAPAFKAGRTTQVTAGRVSVVELDGLQVGYDRGVLTFNDQIEVVSDAGAFSQPGDSGSLIVDAQGVGIGLLFAGGPSGTRDLTYANPLPVALSLLGVTLA